MGAHGMAAVAVKTFPQKGVQLIRRERGLNHTT